MPFIQVAKTSEVTQRLFSNQVNPDGNECPTAFMAKLIANGTLTDLRNTISALFRKLEASKEP
jgi:hypothetical protein